MFGRGRYNRWRRAPLFAPPGYTYVGPCRCGFGPDAYYQDEGGRIIHSSQLCRRTPPAIPTKENLQAETKWLKEDKAALERRIKEIEDNLKQEQK